MIYKKLIYINISQSKVYSNTKLFLTTKNLVALEKIDGHLFKIKVNKIDANLIRNWKKYLIFIIIILSNNIKIYKYFK